MLPHAARLRRKDFDAIWKRSTTACGAFVCIKSGAEAIPTTSSLRCACVVPRKIARRATDRNHQRRRLYAAAATMASDGTFIVTSKTDVTAVPLSDLANDIAATAARARRRH